MAAARDEIRKGGAAVERSGRRARRDVEHGRGWFGALARAGIVAKGVSYGLVGVLAALLVASRSGKATSREGALATLVQEPAGKVVLGLLVVGFAGFAAWQLARTFLGRNDDGAKGWAKRAGYLGRALIYLALTLATARLLFGVRANSQTQDARENTGLVLSWPGGRWIIGAVALGILAAGAWNVYRAVSREFVDAWMGSLSKTAKRWGERAGVVGHLARGIVFGLIGVFLGKAALEYDPKEAVGLDGALQEVAQATYGRWLLGLVALGLVCYGLFCLVDARYRDVSASAGGE